MSNAFLNLPVMSAAALATQLSRMSYQIRSYNSGIPAAAPVGLTVGQAQLIWSCAIELVTEYELISILTGCMRDASAMNVVYQGEVSTLESLPERQDAFHPSTFNILRELAARSPLAEIYDREAGIVLNRKLWSYLTHHLLYLLVRSHQAPELLDELLLTKDLGL